MAELACVRYERYTLGRSMGSGASSAASALEPLQLTQLRAEFESMRGQMSDADVVARLGELLQHPQAAQAARGAVDMESQAGAAAAKFVDQQRAAADAELLMRGSANRRLSTKAVDVQVAVNDASVRAQTVIAQRSQGGAGGTIAAEASSAVVSATQEAQAAATAGRANEDANSQAAAAAAPAPAPAAAHDG